MEGLDDVYSTYYTKEEYDNLVNKINKELEKLAPNAMKKHWKKELKILNLF